MIRFLVTGLKTVKKNNQIESVEMHREFIDALDMVIAISKFEREYPDYIVSTVQQDSYYPYLIWFNEDM